MIFVTGDCHGNFERFKPKYFPEQAQMTKRDIVICAGDFGGVWFGDGRDEAALDWLESLPFTLAFVCGNHENYDALERYPVKDWHGGKVHRIRSHVLHPVSYTHLDVYKRQGLAYLFSVNAGSCCPLGWSIYFPQMHTTVRLAHLKCWNVSITSAKNTVPTMRRCYATIMQSVYCVVRP